MLSHKNNIKLKTTSPNAIVDLLKQLAILINDVSWLKRKISTLDSSKETTSERGIHVHSSCEATKKQTCNLSISVGTSTGTSLEEKQCRLKLMKVGPIITKYWKT